MPIRCARSARQLDAVFATATSPQPGRNLRDEFMADTVAWVLEREERVVIGAPNGHVQRVPLGDRPTIGSLLSPTMGDELVVIGTTYGSGEVINCRQTGQGLGQVEVVVEDLAALPVHTLDAHMASVGSPHLIVDLRDAPASELETATAVLVNHTPFPVAPLDAYDAVAHVQQVRRARRPPPRSSASG